MNQKKIILVTGATGAQGNGVASALLRDGKFQVRCLTRNASSQKARELAAMGAEVVEGDLEDMNSLRAAVDGCYGVFGVTNFWEHFDKEYQQGKNLINVVREKVVQHFVFSSLPDYKALSNGKFAVPHCDLKAELERYAKYLQIPTTFIHIAFYYENFLTFFPPRLAEDGGYNFGFPQGETKLAMVTAEDMGPIVKVVFDNPQLYKNRILGVVGEDGSCEEYAATMSKVLGRNIRYNYIERDTYTAFGFPGAEELANMFEVQRLHIQSRQHHLDECLIMHPEMQSFESWLIKNKHLFFAQEKEVAAAAV